MEQGGIKYITINSAFEVVEENHACIDVGVSGVNTPQFGSKFCHAQIDQFQKLKHYSKI
jgi:hypothetical protein